MVSLRFVVTSSLLVIVSLVQAVNCQLRTDEIEPTIVIQPPLVPAINPQQSFNDSEKLFENVGLYLFKRRIHIEEFYYTKDNSSAPTSAQILALQSQPALPQTPMADTKSTEMWPSTTTRPPPPTADRSNSLSLVAKRASGESAPINLVPQVTPSTSPPTSTTPQPTTAKAIPTTPQPTTARPISPTTASSRPFSFSMAVTPGRLPSPGRQPSGPVSPAPFRLPSILDRFRRPGAAALSTISTTVSTTSTTPSTTAAVSTIASTTMAAAPSTSAPVASLTASTTTTTAPLQTSPAIQSALQALMSLTTPRPSAGGSFESASLVPEINLFVVNRLKRLKFKELSTGEFLNETSPECKKQLRLTDSCLKRVMLISKDVDVPRTEGQLNETYCNNLNETLKCLGGYSNCLSRVPRIMYNFVYLSLKKQLLEICSNPVRIEFLLHANCFQSDADKKILRDLSSRGTLTAVYVLQNVPPGQVIQWGCCGFFKMFEDGKKAIDNLCTKRTGPKTGKWIMDLVMKSAADLLEIGCLRYSSVKTCKANLPGAIETFEALTGGEIADQQYSPVIPLIEIARKLGGEF